MILLLLLLNGLSCRGEISREYPAISDYKEVENLTLTISNNVEKTVIEHQLLYCPIKPLCGGLARRPLPSNSSNIYISCCDQCSCSHVAPADEHCPNIDIQSTSTLQTCIYPQYKEYGQTNLTAIHSYYMFANCATDFTDSDIINKCTSDQRDVDLFDIYLYAPVSQINKTIVYKNIYCAICNHEEESNIESWEANVFCNFGKPFMKTPSNYRELLKEGVCRDVKCPSYYQYDKNNNSCEAIFSNMSNQMYEIYYKTIISDNTCITQSCYQQYASELEFAIKKRMMSDLQGIVECERFSPSEWYSDGLTQRNSSNFIVIIKITFAKLSSHDHERYIKTFASLNEVTIIHKGTFVTVNLNITSSMELEFDRTIEKLPRTLPDKDDEDCIMSFETMSLVSDLFCPRIKVSVDEVVLSSSYLEMSNYNATYDIESVIKNGNHYLVCLYPFLILIRNNTVTRDILTEDTVEEILSLVCSLVSIVSLIITLVIYLVFKKLRTIPGINNMMLSLHLLIAHSLYLFGFNATINDKLCSALGLLTHYFWLASVFWMHICTVHMFRVFFSMKMKPTVKQSKRVVIVYSLYAAIVPVLLVASNITYYLTSDENKKTTGYLGYGETNVI
ncbi:unnamed protein product [Mytilus edulis]|uniref:G-protein coupled receptors family 2 profile 2 domain-containing protein n=1 Tax=Mytilus edulis TaxID=6550 RepID=A0A8S3VPL3_MYTED|nr:unnamed protein product [Mytilus edulis]